MLEILILYLQATFKNSFSAIQDVHALAEQVKNGNTAFPSLYCTNDEYQPLSGNENFLYFRQLGAATESESDEESVSGCDHYVTRTYPMVAIAYIPKDIFKTDNAYIDSKVSGNIANILRVSNYGTLMASMKVEDIHAEVTRISTDRYEVWDQEFKGIDMAARFDHVLCAVEFDLVVSATETCLQNYDCNDETVTVEGDTIVVELSDPSAWHKSGDLIGEVKKLGSLDNFDWQLIRGGVVIATVQAAGLKLDVLNAKATAGTVFLTSDGGVITTRTASQVRTDIGAGTGDGTVTSVGLQAGTSGTDVNITGSPVTGAGSITINIPDASAANRGLVTTGAQTFAGVKTFSSRTVINGNLAVGAGNTLPTAVFDGNGAAYIYLETVGTIGEFGVGRNTTNVATDIGAYAFVNSNIVATDKRIASVSGRTDGATNSGKITFVVWAVGVPAIAGNISSAGNWYIGNSTTSASARLHAVGALNSSICLLQTSASAQIFLARESGGSRQIGLYGATPVSRATTAGAAATYVNNAGTGLTSTDTFDGYTLAQVVVALRNIGILT